MRRIWHSSFVYRIIITVSFGLLLPLTITLAVCFSAYQSMVMDNIKAVSKQQIAFLNNYIYSSFSAVHRTINVWMTNNQIKSYLKQDNASIDEKEYINQSLAQLCTFQDGFLNAYLFSTRHQYLYHAFEETSAPTYFDITSTDWLDSVKCVYDFHSNIYSVNNSLTIACTLPVRDSHNFEFLGYCMIKLSLQDIIESFHASEFPYGELFCVSKDNILVYSTQKSDTLPIDINILKKNEFQMIDDSVFWGSTVPNSDFTVYSVFPSSVLKVGNTMPFFAGAAIAGICIVVSLCFLILLLKYLMKPLKDFSAEMAMANPNKLTPVPISSELDEIGMMKQKYNDMILRINDMIENQYQFDLSLKEAQLNALRLQINPHFVNNTLQMIGTMAIEKDLFDIYELLSSFSKMFYYCLRFKKDIVELKDELEYLEDYIKIQHGRFPEKFHFSSSIDPQTKTLQIPKMSLQPIIENCFEHSFGQMHTLWEIEISSIYLGNHYDIIITDNGCGMTPLNLERLRKKLSDISYDSNIRSSSSIGMTNVNTRIKLLYGKEYGIHVNSAPNLGTEVRISLPAVSRGNSYD